MSEVLRWRPSLSWLASVEQVGATQHFRMSTELVCV